VREHCTCYSARVKVLHVNDYAVRGGAEVLIETTLALLREHGVDAQRFTIDDVPNHRRTARSYISNRAAADALCERLNHFRPDVVHLHNFYHELSPGVLTAIAAHLHHSPLRVVMTAHDYHLVCPNSGGSWFRGGFAGSVPLPRFIEGGQRISLLQLLTRRWDHRSFAHSTLKTAQYAWNYRLLQRQRVIDCVICPSKFMERQVRNAGFNTMYLAHPAPTIDPSATGTPRYGPLRLVFVGRIELEKGLAPFIEMLPEDFQGRLTVIGDGSELARCKHVAHARNWDDRIEFLGQLPHAHTLAIVTRCHVLVLPSRCLENYPLTLIEALACGTNILVSNLGGMREVVEDLKVGWMFDPHDVHNPDSLHAVMREISAQHAAGTLNGIAPAVLLADRSPQQYLAKLMSVYQGERCS
jgi:glycosyltransferase involved in cell wall biosynthesis